MTSKVWMGAQTVAIVALLGWSGWSHVRIGVLEAELAERPVTPSESASPAARVRPMRQAARPMPASPVEAAGADAVEVAAVDDHLWSEEGRAAIDDVVAERERREDDRRAEVWRAMRDAKTEAAIDDVADELQLSDVDVAALQVLVEAYQEARSAQWKAMKSGEDVDAVALMKEGEQAKADYEADLVELLGEEGAAVAQEKLRSRW